MRNPQDSQFRVSRLIYVYLADMVVSVYGAGGAGNNKEVTMPVRSANQSDWTDFGHGSENVENGKLTGKTDTDYFYFLCPECPDQQIMRVLDAIQLDDSKLDHELLQSLESYNSECKSNATSHIAISFKIYCENCGLQDIVKIANHGWQCRKLNTDE